MSQPVKLSSELVLDARIVAEDAELSIAGQIELWAQLGRAIEPLLRGAKALALKRAGKARPVSQLLAEVGSPRGRERLNDDLQARPFPHFEACDDDAGCVIRIDEDGTRVRGRFVQREFVPEGG